jgi:hypothetical protein
VISATGDAGVKNQFASHVHGATRWTTSTFVSLEVSDFVRETSDRANRVVALPQALQ